MTESVTSWAQLIQQIGVSTAVIFLLLWMIYKAGQWVGPNVLIPGGQWVGTQVLIPIRDEILGFFGHLRRWMAEATATLSDHGKSLEHNRTVVDNIDDRLDTICRYPAAGACPLKDVCPVGKDVVDAKKDAPPPAK